MVNAGNQTARGFDIMLSTHPYHHVGPYVSFEYLNAHQDSNVHYGNSYLTTWGKEAIIPPCHGQFWPDLRQQAFLCQCHDALYRTAIRNTGG